jgi:type I restriction enzyme R subunit
LAQYALGGDGGKREEIVAPIGVRMEALLEAIEATEDLLGFRFCSVIGARGFARIKGLADVVNAVYTSHDAKRRSEIFADRSSPDSRRF